MGNICNQTKNKLPKHPSIVIIDPSKNFKTNKTTQSEKDTDETQERENIPFPQGEYHYQLIKDYNE